MSRRGLAWCAAVLVVMLPASCSPAGEEPAAPRDGAATASGRASTQAPSSPEEPSPGDAPDGSPQPTFTPPYQPRGDERAVELPAELPIEAPDSATAEEHAVLAAAGRFMASWDAVLFGAGDERSGILRTATDPQLARLLNYLAESAAKERVIVGEPTELELLAVSVIGDKAEVDLCTIMRDWIQYTGGTPEPQPEVERLILTMSLADGVWLASDTEQADPDPCA
ncbi:hypothetical protein [Jiangella anatolica]|uniref:Lipoprotein n=1 Tax=Jiangella anatolica TaxID=2670374 RepID=A0A2W2BV44_9ACTN|nr:hypothetical protein [Jiangella anatolica]PZF80019.1 hypothetical protein C1I92_28175 [Jiangella anatolica]